MPFIELLYKKSKKGAVYAEYANRQVFREKELFFGKMDHYHALMILLSYHQS